MAHRPVTLIELWELEVAKVVGDYNKPRHTGLNVTGVPVDSFPYRDKSWSAAVRELQELGVPYLEAAQALFDGKWIRKPDPSGNREKKK